MWRTSGLFSLLFLPIMAAAQPEIVPAEHAVYDWLADQRVAGWLPEYRHEGLPVDRATVRRHLDSLATRRASLSSSGRYWLTEYEREFFEPLDHVHSYVGDGEAKWSDANAERTWGYVRDDDWRVSIWGEGMLVRRHAEGVRIDRRTRTATGWARSARLTIEASYRDRIGLYTSTIAGATINGDTEVLDADPVFRNIYYVTRDPDNISGSYDRTTASLRIAQGPFSAEIANERLRYGASVEDPLILSDNADYLPFIRLELATRSVTLQSVHAALSSPSRFVLDDPTEDDRFLDGPERFLAIHRLEVQPTSWWTAAYTGMAVYGRRGPEIAYLNPVYPLKPAEHALYDRDNTLFALETTVRPIRGFEGSFTWLVDDLATATLGDSSYGNKWAIQAGLKATLPRTGATLFGEYVRIEPYTYTHRFRENGVFFNSYTHNGFGLGHPLGPNADQWIVGASVWMPFRARARFSGRYVRKGENLVDPISGEMTTVGGDVRLGVAPVDGLKSFLSGDLFQGPGARAMIEVEPARGVAFRLYADRQWWDNRPSETFVRFGLAVRP